MSYYKVFHSPDEVNEWVYKNYTESQISQFDLNKQPYLSPLTLYTGCMSESINEMLRKGEISDSDTHFEGLQYDLCRIYIPENITVWRYINFSEMVLLWWKTLFGRAYIYPAFVSTTLLKDYFSGQARINPIVIRINAPKGTFGMYITELSDAAIAEYEVLFAHHLALKRTGFLTYEIIREPPDEKYRGAYIEESDY